MSDDMKRLLAGFDRRDDPSEGKAGELSDEEAIAALDAKSGDPEDVDLWRTIDTVAGQRMRPPQSLADVRRSYLNARRRR